MGEGGQYLPQYHGFDGYVGVGNGVDDWSLDQSGTIR
jgi:hypothetical protein